MRRAYTIVLRLYPRDYRIWFGAEMLAAFEASRDESVRFYSRELAGLAKGAIAEWIAKLTSSSLVRSRCLPDWRMMRPAGVSREVWFSRTPPGYICSSDTSR